MRITAELQEAINNGIIDEDNVLSVIMASKKQSVRKTHKYAITPPNDSKGSRWQTRYVGSDGKSKIIKAQTEDELLDKLVRLYFPDKKKFTFNDLFEEWIAYYSKISNSGNTVKRHRQRYSKYFATSKLANMILTHIDTLLLEEECNRIIKEYVLTRKEWTNAKTILKGMFRYAIRRNYLSSNPLDNIQIVAKYRQTIKKTGKTETFNTDELNSLRSYLDHMYSETQDAAFMAVAFCLLTGLRVGELVALKWEDVSENHLHITGEEIKDQSANVYHIVNHTKTHQDRYVPLIPKAQDILASIERTSDFIFARSGERITSRQIAYVLEKYAQAQGIRTKSTHKMRKTFASLLNANGVPLDCIREVLGHNSLSTTLGYIYNPLTDAETYDLIAKAL